MDLIQAAPAPPRSARREVIEAARGGGPELLGRAELNGTMAHDIWLGGQGRLLFRGVWEGV